MPTEARSFNSSCSGLNSIPSNHRASDGPTISRLLARTKRKQYIFKNRLKKRITWFTSTSLPGPFSFLEVFVYPSVTVSPWTYKKFRQCLISNLVEGKWFWPCFQVHSCFGQHIFQPIPRKRVSWCLFPAGTLYQTQVTISRWLDFLIDPTHHLRC